MTNNKNNSNNNNNDNSKIINDNCLEIQHIAYVNGICFIIFTVIVTKILHINFSKYITFIVKINREYRYKKTNFTRKTVRSVIALNTVNSIIALLT